MKEQPNPNDVPHPVEQAENVLKNFMRRLKQRRFITTKGGKTKK